MSRRILAALALVALSLAIVLFSSRRCERLASRSLSASPPVSEQPQQPPALAPPVLPERVEVAVEPVISATQGKAAPEVELEKADLAKRDCLEIEVVDPEQRPVADADLSIRGVRKHGDAGSWYQMRDGPATARTDGLGKARISYVRWVDIDGRTISVDLEVKHPDFCAFRDTSFSIGEGQHQVVLQRGAMVVVRGWVGSPLSVVNNLEIRVESEARLLSADWKLEPIGRYSTQRLSPGNHVIWLTHEEAARGKLASAITPFEIGENETKELAIELRPLVTLRGRLDDRIPRPVVDGHVALNLHQGGLEADEPSIDRGFETVVQADGTFELSDVPPARGQIIALCRGWVSRRTRADSPEEAGIHFSGSRESNGLPDEETLERVRAFMDLDEHFEAQRVLLPVSDPIVIEMEPTGSVDVTVRTPEELPLARATVSASPNVHWIGVGWTIFPWGSWNATTDESGRARIENLPPASSLWVSASHESFRMRREQRDRNPSVKIASGETTALEFVLEPGKEE